METLSGIPTNQIEMHTNGYAAEIETQFIETQRLMREGFVPYKYDPSKFGAAIEAFHDPAAATVDESFVDSAVDPSERASYNGHFSPFEEKMAEMIMRTGVYNALTDETGYPYNEPIQGEAAEEVHAKVLETLKSGSIITIAPFAVEPETIEGVLHYNAGRLGAQNVLAVDAGIDAISGEKARATGVETVNQKDILAGIDLAKLQEMGIIPEGIDKLKGTKGLTMYAGILKLAMEGKLTKNHYIAFHDTDIENAGPAEGKGSTEDYAALDYLAVPLAYPVTEDMEIDAVHIARTGSGRNNESWFGENQHYLNSKNPELRRISHHVAGFMWALTGERLIRGDILANMPWPTDMNIETMLDVALAGIEVRKGKRTVPQVINPAQKNENRISPDHREWGMIYACEQGLRSYYEVIEQTGRFPHEWDAEDIGLYNLYYGNKPGRTSTKNNVVNQPNMFAKTNRGILLPPVNMLIQSGAFDPQATQ